MDNIEREKLIKIILPNITEEDFVNNFIDMTDSNTGLSYKGEYVYCPVHIGLEDCCQNNCADCWLQAFNELKEEQNNKKKLIVLIGESASGKSTLEKKLNGTGLFKKTVSHTTRPMREGEVNGIDYYFVTDKEFETKLSKGEFIEDTVYNDWHYGLSIEEINNSDLPVVLVVNPQGFRQIKEIKQFDIISFYIRANWRTRLKRMVDRGDDVMELFRRIISDMGVFQNIEKEVDYIIYNDCYGDSNSIEAPFVEMINILKNKQFY